MRPEPYIEEALYQERLEAEHKKYLRGCPWCIVCDEQISDPRCYVMDPDDKMGSCICHDCMMVQLEKMRKAQINNYLMEVIAEEIEYNCEKTTPHDERLEELNYCF